MSRVAYPHVPVEPILRMTSGDVRAAAQTIGVSERTVHRWRHEGVPLFAADHAAISFGLHPASVWRDWFTIDIDEQERASA